MADIKIPKTEFIDISEREKHARNQIDIDIESLKKRKDRRGLSEADRAEMARLKDLKAVRDAGAPVAYFDPLFATMRSKLADSGSELRPLKLDHTAGELSVAIVGVGAKPPGKAAADAMIARAGLVLGLLQLTNAPLPILKAVKDKNGNFTGVEPDDKDPNKAKFSEAFFAAVGRSAGHIELAVRTLKTIAGAVDIAGDRQKPKVSSLEYARVVDKLIRQGVESGDANLKRHVDESLDRVQAGDEAKPEHEIAILLPDLELTTDNEVIEDNIRLIGPMIFASMFDELKAFQVVDRLIEMSQRGELALGKGKAGTRLYNYWRQAPNRMSETERQTFYAITLGLPTGPPGVTVNREFPDLWIRFLSSVTTLVRESRVDQLIRSGLPYAINQQQVKKTARDLTANMSLYGYGMAYYAAVDLQKQINEMIELLQDDELKKAFGARDMWGVIDQVAQTELGGARSGSKYRMLAMSGNIVTTWLANNLGRIKDPTRQMIDLKAVENEPSRPRGQTAATHPTDYDLVNACEMWLADSAMDENRVEELSQPRESPQQPSRPIQIPSFARDLLAGAGLGMEMSAPGRSGRVARPTSRGNGHYLGY